MTSSAANRRLYSLSAPKSVKSPQWLFHFTHSFLSSILCSPSNSPLCIHSTTCCWTNFHRLLGIGCKKVGNDDWGHSSNSFGPTTTKKVWPSEVKRQQKGPNSEQNWRFWPKEMLIPFLFCLLLFSLSSNCAEDQTFYELLGVSQDADLLSIRKAFKRLAIQKHPDKNPVGKYWHFDT